MPNDLKQIVFLIIGKAGRSAPELSSNESVRDKRVQAFLSSPRGTSDHSYFKYFGLQTERVSLWKYYRSRTIGALSAVNACRLLSQQTEIDKLSKSPEKNSFSCVAQKGPKYLLQYLQV